MMDDIQLWKSNNLSEDERRIILWNLGFFSTAESLTANNIVLGIYSLIRNPECRQYLIRQAYEEALHTEMFIYICDSLGLDSDIVYDMYNSVPSIREKDAFVISLTTCLFDNNFKTDSVENIRKFVRDLIGYYVIMEGIFFYAGFAVALNMKRQHKMTAIGKQFEYTLRDESVHVGFGVNLINTILAENPGVASAEFLAEVVSLIKEGCRLESLYIDDACPNGILGITPDSLKRYIQYIADKRLNQLNLPKEYNVTNPFPWMSESIDIPREANFFETTVTEYSQKQLEW